MKQLNVELLKKFLALAGNNLDGKWLLLGGTLLPAVGVNIRSTVDIDLVGLGEKERGQSLELMDLAEKLGLSIETINQAAAHFLKKIKYNKSDLFILHQGNKATIFRPSVELYWKLKIPRLSETDVIDCQYYYRYCISQGDPQNSSKLSAAVKSSMKLQSSPERRARLKKLLGLIEAHYLIS